MFRGARGLAAREEARLSYAAYAHLPEAVLRYELTDLRLFLAIAEAQNLSAGAAVVHITASAASYRLKNLEQAMHTPLFVRAARGMELTPAGETLLAHVRDLFVNIERMHGEVGRFSAGLKGHIRLLANSSSLNGFVTRAVSRFLIANPDINIELEERASHTILPSVAAQEADVGICAGTVESADMRVLRYAVDELVLVTPPGHALAGQEGIRFLAALDYDFVSINRTTSNFLFLRETAQRAGKHPNVRLHAHDFDAVLSLVADGVGVALVPRSVAAEALAQDRIAVATIDEPWARRELHLIAPPAGRLPGFTEAFIQFLVNDPRVVATRQEKGADES
jgi:DNA-binding transcriptional LysR family regulator